jgi:hypothetical protein
MGTTFLLLLYITLAISYTEATVRPVSANSRCGGRGIVVRGQIFL